MSQASFLNRQGLNLRPDPARVIVRPFKPATEPRDLNPTDKMRANHIVDRVLALSSEAVAVQLADVLDNSRGDIVTSWSGSRPERMKWRTLSPRMASSRRRSAS